MCAYKEWSPTLTRSRAAGYWITSRRRRMRPAEMFKVMGFAPDCIRPVAPAAMGRLAGNAMCVPLVRVLLEALLPQLFEELECK